MFIYKFPLASLTSDKGGSTIPIYGFEKALLKIVLCLPVEFTLGLSRIKGA
jgi:hypothetical protein